LRIAQLLSGKMRPSSVSSACESCGRAYSRIAEPQAEAGVRDPQVHPARDAHRPVVHLVIFPPHAPHGVHEQPALLEDVRDHLGARRPRLALEVLLGQAHVRRLILAPRAVGPPPHPRHAEERRLVGQQHHVRLVHGRRHVVERQDVVVARHLVVHEADPLAPAVGVLRPRVRDLDVGVPRLALGDQVVEHHRPRLLARRQRHVHPPARVAAQIVDVALEPLAPQQHVAERRVVRRRTHWRAAADRRVARVIHPGLLRDALAGGQRPHLRHRSDPDRDAQFRPALGTPVRQAHLHRALGIPCPLLDDVLGMRRHEDPRKPPPLEQHEHLPADAADRRRVELLFRVRRRLGQSDRHRPGALPRRHVAVRRLPQHDRQRLHVPKRRQAGMASVQGVRRILRTAVEHLERGYLERSSPPSTRTGHARCQHCGSHQRPRPRHPPRAADHGIVSPVCAAPGTPPGTGTPTSAPHCQSARPTRAPTRPFGAGHGSGEPLAASATNIPPFPTQAPPDPAGAVERLYCDHNPRVKQILRLPPGTAGSPG